MRVRQFRPLCCFVLLISLVRPQSNSEPFEAVFTRLAKTEVFAFGGIGVAGVTSQGEKVFRILRARASARADFDRLFQNGNSEAKAYALVGMQEIDVLRYRELAKSFAQSKQELTMMSGCIVYHLQPAHVIKEIDKGQFKPFVRSPRKLN